MDNKDQNLQEFNLEDIMKEFGAVEDSQPVQSEPVVEAPVPVEETPAEEAPAGATPAAPVEALPETDETPVQEDTAPPEEDKEESDASQEDAAVTGDTIRLDDLSQVADAAITPEEIPGEPLSEDWEPEDDEPIEEMEAPVEEDFVPPPPIVFRPRSRLKELKKKLIAGPEKRYYELAEIGLGKLQVAIFLNLLMVLICAGATAMFAAGIVPEERLRLMVFSQILAMLVSALLGCHCLIDGAADLFKGKFSLNTMLLISFIVCCVDGVFCLMELRVPCCAAFSLEVTMSLWNRYQQRNTEMGQMDTLRKAIRLDSVVKVDNFYEGRPGLLRGEGQVEDFMDNYTATTGPEKIQGLYAFISFLACVAIAVLAGLLHSSVSLAFQIMATSLLVAIPASFFISLSRPMAILERRLHMVGTVLCGWQGVKGLCGSAAIPLSDEDIFPLGSTKLNGVKFYGDRQPDQVIAYATALIRESGGGLVPVFNQLLKNRNGAEYDVENFNNYGSGGIGGEVCDEPVLLGTLNFLQDMGVEIPDGTMVNQAVYAAIDGQLCAVFAISYARMKSSAAGLVSLCGYRKLTPVLTCGDFMLTESFLRSKFNINTRRMAFPTKEVRAGLAARQPEEGLTALALTTQDGLAPAAYAISGARTLRTASKLGLIIHMIGGILGMLIMLALAYLGSVELLTPVNVLLYQLVWLVPGLLVTEWTRTV